MGEWDRVEWAGIGWDGAGRGGVGGVGGVVSGLVYAPWYSERPDH